MGKLGGILEGSAFFNVFFIRNPKKIIEVSSTHYTQELFLSYAVISFKLDF